MVCNLPGPCPPTCSRPLVVPHVPSPRRVEIAFLAGFMVVSSTSGVGLRVTAAVRRKCDVRSLEAPRGGRDEGDAAGVVSNNDTSFDGRFTSSVHLIFVIKVDARSVAGKQRTWGWTGRSPSRTEYDVDVPYTVKKGLSIAGFLFMPAFN